MFGLQDRDLAAAGAMTVMAVAAAAGLGAEALAIAATALLAACLSLIGLTDLRFQRIPDFLSLPLIPLGLAVALALWPTAFVLHVAGSAAGFAAFWAVRFAYRRWRGVEGLGLGDVKLMAAAGAWTGIDRLAAITLIACAAALVALLLRGGHRPLRRTRIAFGVFLGPAILLAWLHLAAAQ